VIRQLDLRQPFLLLEVLQDCAVLAAAASSACPADRGNSESISLLGALPLLTGGVCNYDAFDVRGELKQFFSDEKTLENRALNLTEAQPLRAVLARLLCRLRPGGQDPLKAELVRRGIVIIEDFLHPTFFAAVQREADELMATTDPTWFLLSGTTEVRRLLLPRWIPSSTRSSCSGGPITSCRTGDGRRTKEVSTRMGRRRTCRRLALGGYSEQMDDTELHIDTFFGTHKFWPYLDHITEANGTFVYVPGSHVLGRVRLRYEYSESNTTNRKSRRVSEEEVRSRGLERRVIDCQRNMLVLANTYGYHSRLLREAGASRRALHKEYRYNPFKLERRIGRPPAHQ
jgi:hypothetical protein